MRVSYVAKNEITSRFRQQCFRASRFARKLLGLRRCLIYHRGVKLYKADGLRCRAVGVLSSRVPSSTLHPPENANEYVVISKNRAVCAFCVCVYAALPPPPRRRGDDVEPLRKRRLTPPTWECFSVWRHRMLAIVPVLPEASCFLLFLSQCALWFPASLPFFSCAGSEK